MGRRWIVGCSLAVACGARELPAEPAGDQAVGAAPTWARDWHARAALASERGDTAEAVRAEDWLLRLDGDAPRAWLAAGAFRSARGDLEGARAAYQRASELGAVGAAAFGLGSLSPDGSTDAAEHYATAADAGFAPAWAAWHASAIAGADDELALQVLDRWGEVDVPVPSVASRGGAMFAAGRMEQATADLEVAMGSHFASAERLDQWRRAAEASCRIGRVWRWVMAHDLTGFDPPWREAARAVMGSAGDTQGWVRYGGEGAPPDSATCSLPRIDAYTSCDDLPNPSYLQMRAPLADDALESLAYALARCGQTERSAECFEAAIEVTRVPATRTRLRAALLDVRSQMPDASAGEER